MEYQTLNYCLADGIALVTLNRPDVMNAMSAQMRAELTDAIPRAGREARVMVLTGEGRGFCTGQDLGDRADTSDIDLERTLRDEYGPMLRAFNDLKIPSISAVNGPAAGAGASLALMADVVIATRSAYFMQAFSRIGLIPDAGGTYWLPRLMGHAKAMGAALFADKISAEQAERWGLIWEVAEDDAFDATWRARATQLAQGPTLAYGAIKDVLNASMSNDFEAQFSLESRVQGRLGKSRDFQEGVTAFLEKRKPSYEGR